MWHNWFTKPEHFSSSRDYFFTKTSVVFSPSLPPSLSLFLPLSPPHSLHVHPKLSAVMIVSHMHLELLLFMRNTGREGGRKGKREEEEEGKGGRGREGGREREREREGEGGRG